MLWGLLLLLVPLSPSQGFKFTIVHNNDMHARYDPMKGRSGACPQGDDEKGLCFGGFARVATAVAKAKAEGPTLYLNAGDTFHGTPWYDVYKGRLAGELMNLLEPDAMALGNHELDDNVAGLLPFLGTVTFPIVCCNMNLSREPQLSGFRKLVKSTVITRLGKKIGIIGYITPLTKYYVPNNNIEYDDEISCINLEAKKLIRKGVNIIIALGHSGYEKDRMIAMHCPDVDVVIGGHSHTFLYKGTPPAEDRPEGDYPTVMIRPNGRRVPVLQAYAFTKYLGRIDLEFDDLGNLVNFTGSPILLDKSIPQESNIKSILNAKRKKIEMFNKDYLAERNYFLHHIKFSNLNDENSLGNVGQIVNKLILISTYLLVRLF